MRARDAWSPGLICEILMFHSICLLSSAISMSSGWFFRSQNGCGKKTAGSAGDYPEEEEVAKEAVKSKVVFKMKKA